MSASNIPQNNVCYRVQNLDFGTYLGLIDDYPVSRTQRKASLVARPMKGGVKHQEWIFQDLGNGAWSIVNNGATFYIDSKSTPTAAFYNPRSGIPASSKVIIDQENDTHVVKLKIGGGLLQSRTGFDLEIGDDTDEDKVKWRLIEVCPILGQIGYKYRLRGFNGRILNFGGNGTLSAMVLADAVKDASNKTLWVVEPAPGGKCTVKLNGGGTADYLSCQSHYTNGQDNWLAVKGSEFQWDLESIGGFAYQIVKPGVDKDLALTIENDESIILKPNKVGHGQIWLVERDYN